MRDFRRLPGAHQRRIVRRAMPTGRVYIPDYDGRRAAMTLVARGIFEAMVGFPNAWQVVEGITAHDLRTLIGDA